MARLFALILLFYSFHSFGQITDLKLGSDIWPPFTNSPGETAFASEIVKEALNRNKVAIDQRTMEFNVVLKAIENEALDGSGAMWKTEERESNLYFSEPYLQNQLVLVARKESGLQVDQLSDVAGKKLALVESYAYGEEINAISEVEFVYGKSDQTNFLKLLQGEVDYMLIDELPIRYLMQSQPQKFNENLIISKEPVIVKSLHLAIRKDIEGAEELLAEFNATIKKMLADGTYNRILKLNWIQADVDGDGKLELVGGKNSAGALASANEYKVNHSDSSQYPVASGNTYYINGKVYTNWEDVPADFKRGPGSEEDVETFNFLRFNF
jgi:polar amino acid transport system substrate-binding protein